MQFCSAKRRKDRIFSYCKDSKMLVLSRTVSERIVIDGPAIIEVVRLSGNRVSLGFIAPESTNIKRWELIGDVANDQDANQGDSSHASDISRDTASSAR